MKQIPLFLCLALTISCVNQAVNHPNSEAVVTKDRFILRPIDDTEINPTGAVFEVERLPDVEVPKVGTVAAYTFLGRNFQVDKKLTLASQSINGTIKSLYNYQVDDDGTLGRQVPDGTMLFENEVLLMFDFAKGQPLRYWLYSKDGKIRLSRLIVPYPIEKHAKDGAYFSVRRVTPDARLVLCEGVNFMPDEQLYLSTQTGTDIIANTPIACVNGKFSIALEPGLTGKSGGKAFVELKRVNSDHTVIERLLLEYPWGCEASNSKNIIAPSRYVDADTFYMLSQKSQQDMQG